VVDLSTDHHVVSLGTTGCRIDATGSRSRRLGKRLFEVSGRGLRDGAIRVTSLDAGTYLAAFVTKH
jgi:hypothetical protein